MRQYPPTAGTEACLGYCTKGTVYPAIDMARMSSVNVICYVGPAAHDILNIYTVVSKQTKIEQRGLVGQLLYVQY